MRIGFFGLLTIVLIALKLTGTITISWLLILATPFVGFILVTFLIVMALAITMMLK